MSGQTLPAYESHPPTWLPRAHAEADLGYTGFYPPRPGQDEDVLSASNVKNGYVLGFAVTAESYSSQVSISENLRSHETVLKLEDLMNEVFSRKAKQAPFVPPHTFRVPSRVTLNDTKRQAWFDDLANPNVPLSKLGKSVPHGAKGADLLDLLHLKNVSVPRAVWFLRVFGANETAGLRNKPNYNPTQYSTEWTNVVTSHLRKQLLDIALPSPVRAGVNIKQTFKGVLADPENRDKWVSRFSYCLRLLRSFYAEGLVDKGAFFVWLVNQMGSCNLAQAGFVTRIVDEYFDGMMSCRALTRPFLEAYLSKLAEIRTTSAKEYLNETDALIMSHVQRLSLTIPDTFVSPKLWSGYADLIADILVTEITDNAQDEMTENGTHYLSQHMVFNLADIKKRNETMLFRNFPDVSSVRLGSAVSDVEMLNSITNDTDVATLPFFPVASEDWSGMPEKLTTLLTWSVTPLQFGDHRPFVTVTLIRHWRLKAGERANRRDVMPPDELLQDRLFEWLDSAEVSKDTQNIRTIALLYGELVKHHLFSYTGYLQRLIARGESGLSFAEPGTPSRHRSFLRWIPLYNIPSSVINQRKVTLYGLSRVYPEESIIQAIKDEIRTILPELFGGQPNTSLPTPSNISTDYNNLLSACRSDQVRIFKWLLPPLQQTIVQQENEVSHTTLLKCYCVAVELMTRTSCFDTVLELTTYLLEHSSTADLLIPVIDTFRRHATVWAAMDVKRDIIVALSSAHHVWKLRGIQSRPLLALLMEFDAGRYLTDALREEIANDIAVVAMALQPHTDHPNLVPDVLPEILMLVDNAEADSPSMLANGLWIKYRMSFDWAWKVWDNTIASLRQIPVMTPDTRTRRTLALRYGTFLWHVGQHLPAGLDSQVLRWFLGPGRNEMAALSADAWDVVTVVLLYLSVHGALQTTTILEGLVYPAWQQGAHLPNNQQAQAMAMNLRAANNICQQLLLNENCNEDFMPPTSLIDVQALYTRRQDVYKEPHFPLLIANIPALVSLENNANIPEDLRQEAKAIRQRLCEEDPFRQGVYRNLNIVREAFEKSLQSAEGMSEELSKQTVAALRMVLGEGTEDLELSRWPDNASLLSPWKISATAIQLQFVLRQMGRSNAQRARAANVAALDKLTTMIFHNALSPEEANFVAQMTKGVGSEISGKFINNGLRRVTDVISRMTFTLPVLKDSLVRAEELLRVLIYVAEPLRDDPAGLPAVGSDIQDSFLPLLLSKWEELSRLIQADALEQETRVSFSEAVILLARFLQFYLAFRGIWTDKARETSTKLAQILFNLLVSHATGVNADYVAYPLLLDTLYYLLDEIPNDSKAGVFDPFRAYPDMPVSALPSDLPHEYLLQLRSLLPELPTVSSIANLNIAHRDPAGQLVIGGNVVNRPWEWIENLGDAPGSEPKYQESSQRFLKGKEPVKNAGSLSLLTFGARTTGDTIMAHIPDSDARLQSSLRTFEDGLSYEPVFSRDWRESRLDLSDDLMKNENGSRTKGDLSYESKSSPMALQSRGDQRITPRGSPVSTSSHSRGSVASMRQSPGLAAPNRISSSSAAPEIIDVDSFSMSNKRKGTDDSDDDIIIVEGPNTPRNKKPKSKLPVKKTGKRR
ncbi:rna polymerase ii mediator complex component [Moniliophthora roreri MCA 2997]|uniref:Mediator of RNA polymerase II transcription subunit 12 n=2 Tax=Moniliophthora roreri TaxID=221103 RepID=V2WVZ3_MONRO|nr:rna polymerase ii mediator complex component [Moniliophthora roreri MCA 2997]KAI3596955.1 rna polymerase ii mediator complex component [Moniliophthora roreri]